MSGFPGVRYSGEGVRLDSAGPDLSQADIDAHRYRSLVTRDDLCPVGEIWLLDDRAAVGDIAAQTLSNALGLILQRRSILLLSREQKTGAHVRDALLDDVVAVEKAMDQYRAAVADLLGPSREGNTGAVGHA